MRYYCERLKEHSGNLMGTLWEQTQKRIFGCDICTSRVITWKAKKKEKKRRFLLGIGSKSYLSPMFDIYVT